MRIVMVIIILLFGVLAVNKPIFEKYDLNKEEGNDISLTFVKIISVEGTKYMVQTGFTGENALVISGGAFKVGETVSFYGTARQGVLYANKYHVHAVPRASYVLSVLGLVMFIFLFFREWKIEKLGFVRRN